MHLFITLFVFIFSVSSNNFVLAQGELIKDPIIFEYNKKFLALGDSYTIGESVDEHESWPHLLQNALKEVGIHFEKPQIIAKTGWRTDELIHASQSAIGHNNYDLVSLLIGVNNQYQGHSLEVYQKEFEDLLNISITAASNDPHRVFVLSIPDYGHTPFSLDSLEEIKREINLFNDWNRTISEKYGVFYFDITEISRMVLDDITLVAQDNLHPSAKQYDLWVREILKNQMFIEQHS